MTDSSKTIIFRGLEKKEEILFKSFLNLVKNDLTCELELIKDPNALLDEADYLIADSDYQLSEEEETMAPLPTLRVGADAAQEAADYLVRPVQWSDFKEGLIALELAGIVEPSTDEGRLLPTDFSLEAPDADDQGSLIDKEDETQSFVEATAYNFELDKMTVDDNSFTNSEYVKAAADDVKGFHQEDGSPQAVMLMSDDESANSNSVLVIETNSLDAWDMDDSEFDELHSHSVETPSELELPDLSTRERKVAKTKLATGTAVESYAEMWMTEQEVMAGPQTLLVVRPGERKVYSAKEPGRWIVSMRKKELTSVPLADNWKATDDLKAYPLERLIWINALVGRHDHLDDEMSDNQEVMLLKWPHFELLELDNALLKMTTMLFVAPESAYSLMQKTGEGRAVVYGMLNACKELDLLASESQIRKITARKNDDESGVFGKLKDAFR